MKHLKILILIVLLIHISDNAKAQAYARQYQLRGTIVDSRTQKGVSKIPFVVKPFNRRVEANKQGEFLFQFKQGEYKIIIDFYPFTKKEVAINLVSDTTLLIELATSEETIYIPDVEVFSVKPTTNLPAGIVQTDRVTLQNFPALIGERDILKALSQTSGVTSSSEGAADMQVRGGSHGQNLYLLNGIPLYSTEHFWGMVSAYNPLIVKSAKLYKSGFPAEYGGKVSSVIDVQTDDADLKKFRGAADISLLSSKLMLNTPIIKDKMALSLSGRISNYSLVNIISRLNLKPETPVYNLYFGDINADFHWKISENDKLKITWFNNNDGFGVITEDENYMTDSWMNNAQKNISANWYRKVGHNAENHLMTYYDSYKFDFGLENTSIDKTQKSTFRMITGIGSWGVSDKFQVDLSDHLKLKSGLSFTAYRFSPFTGSFSDSTFRKPETRNNLHTYDITAFTDGNWTFRPKQTVSAGVRINSFANKQSFFNSFEPRVSYHGEFKNAFSLSASAGRLSQPVHRLANTGLGIPIALFVPSADYLKPQNSWNFSLGTAKDFKTEKWAASLKADAWFKTFQNIAEFKDGIDAFTIMMENLDILNHPTDFVTQGEGKAYGLDINSSITNKKWSITADYTLMQAIHQFDELNAGKPFAASTDIRHSINLTFKRYLSDHLNICISWQYRTGKPITVPTRLFMYPNYNPDNGKIENSYKHILVVEEARNNYRTKSFHKADVAINRDYLAFGKYEANFSLGFYNLYNRANPYIYFITQKRNADGSYKPVLKSMQIFPILPSFSWMMRF